MSKQIALSFGILSVACALSAHAQKPTSAPANALGQCKDGSYVSTGSKRTACVLHGGMKVWYLDGTPNTGGAIPQDDGRMEPGRTATGRNVGGVPSDALGLCNDGTYVSTGTKHSACSQHGGMKIWYPDGTPNTGGAIPQDDGHMEPGKTATGRRVNGVPSDALGLCNDGTYVSTGTKHSACSQHGGMKIWYPDGTPNTPHN